MASVLDGISNFINSVFDFFRSLLYNVLAVLQSFFAVITNALKRVAHLSEGLVRFVLGMALFYIEMKRDVDYDVDNIVILGVIAGALVAYSAYQQRHGRIYQGRSGVG